MLGARKNAAKNSNFFPLLAYRNGGMYRKHQFNVQNKRIALYFGLAASSKQFRGCRSFSPISRFSPPPFSLSLSLSTLLHSQASVYNMCIEQIPQIALSHCCCPVVRVLAPAVAADRIVAYLKGSPFSQAENREIRQDTMPIIVSQFDQGRRTRNREKEREKERERTRAPVTSSDQVCFLLFFFIRQVFKRTHFHFQDEHVIFANT